MDTLRLLICHTCKTIEEIPDFQGPPEQDVLLEHALEPHRFPDGNEHIGKMAQVMKDDWANHRYRTAIEAEIRAAVAKSTGLPPAFYETKNNFQADALRCYSDHRRPDQGCIDWKIERKRLGNPTKLGWKIGPKMYLCDFCPVKSWVKTQERHKAGLYKEK